MNPQIVSQGYQPQHQRQTSSGAPYVPSQQISAEAQYQQQFHLLPPMNHPPPPLQHHHEHAHAHQQPMQQAHLHLLQSFWMSQMHDVENVPQDFKLHHLPLARIKKVMKTDEDVKAKMISAEAPMLFDRGCEIFITELTLRAWIHAEENKRRTLQRSDIAAAIVKTDMFDFLIDIVPREEYKMSVTKETKASNYHHPTAEQRRNQDMFMPPPTGAEPNLAASALEGYGYPYILENEAFSMGMDPNQQQQQQQQQQQLQMQYMGVNPQQAI